MTDSDTAMSVETDTAAKEHSDPLEQSGPVELDQLQFDFQDTNGDHDFKLTDDGDNISETCARGDNSEPSALSSLIPLDINNSTAAEDLLDCKDKLEGEDSDTVHQPQGVPLPDVVSDGLLSFGQAADIVPLDVPESHSAADDGVTCVEIAGGVIVNEREKLYEQSTGNKKVSELEGTEVSLKESVRSLQDVIIESGPFPENTRPANLLQEKTSTKDNEDSESEFEDEYAEQEVVQKSESESDSEFEVPDRPQETSQSNFSNQTMAAKVISNQNVAPEPSNSQTSSLPLSPPSTQPYTADASSSVTAASAAIPTSIQQSHSETPSIQSSSQISPNFTSKSIIPTPQISTGLPSHSASGVTQSLEQPLETVTQPQERPQVQSSDDWENVQTIQAEFAENKNDDGQTSAPVHSTPLLAMNDAVNHFRESDLSAVRPNVRMSIDRHGFSALTHFLFGPPRLHRDLQSEKELVFLIAGSPLNNDETVHVQLLQSIYRILTGSRFDCQRFGSHWEEIGFQGRDPGTDIRGVGMLGLVQLLYFLRNPKSAQLARDVYKLSLHPTQNFPFCIMGINMSRICVQSLREDLINKECNKRHSVMEVVNEFYVGTYLHLYMIWRQGKTITDSGHVIKEVETFAKKNTKSVFKNLEEYLKRKPAAQADVTVEEGQEEFLSVCKEE